jgi:MFS family permease
MILGSLAEFFSVFCTSDEGFMAVSVISGVCLGSAIVTSFVYIHEFIVGDVRGLYTALIFASWGLGTTLMSLLQSIITDWTTRTMVVACFNVLWVPLLCRFHESPRFLAANQGKFAEARVVLNHIAKCNGSKEFIEMLEGEKVIGYQESGSLTTPSSPGHSAKYSFVPITNGIVGVSESQTDDVKKYGFFELVTLKSTRAVFFVLAFLWFNVSAGYYVVVFSVPHLVVDTFWTEAFVAFGETLSCLVVTVLMNKLGRQLSLVVHFAVAGTCCILSLAFISKHYPNDTMMKINKLFRIILVSVARFALVSARLTSFMFTIEYFATNIRSIAIGSLILMTLLGAIICPFIILLGETLGIHGLFFMSLFLIVSSFCSCLLPETLGKTMEDYVEE